ncbi:uncharacterized protein [Primulina eburnea]|uniref:uncharacterized protein isoform X1 n=1 Tax=Primulina eburnea TaxID=1245227 RepID=UPI003C6CAEDD
MIKRQFYRFEHGDRDAPSDSSSSDSEVEAETNDGTEVEDEEDNEFGEIGEKEIMSSSSGYESEDSSVNEINLDSSGLPTSDDDMTTENGGQDIVGVFQDTRAVLISLITGINLKRTTLNLIWQIVS